MDQLALQSTFAKIRNPYGLRRWAYRETTANPTPDFRSGVAQLFGQFAQPYAENNAPLLISRLSNGDTIAQLVPFRDQWVRPAERWFKATLTTSGSDRIVSVLAGTPFLAEDPFQPAVQYRAKPGDDIFLDDGAGTIYEAKISVIDPLVGPSGNSVVIVTKAGSSLPPDGTYYVNHTLDAYLIRLTVSYMIPQADFSALDGTVHVNPFQTKIQLSYFDNSGSTVVEQYERVPVKELSTIAADVPFAFIEVLGDRFGQATAPAPLTYYQIFEVFEFHVARAPDKLEVLFDNTGPGAPFSAVQLGNLGVYYGHTVPALASVPPNIFPPNPNPPPSPRYNLYPPPDPEDFWTGSGDIVVMPVGLTCPAGFESIAQILSRANDHYVTDSATGRPVVFEFGTALAMSVTGAGNTAFTGTLPATAIDPSTGDSLIGSDNNTATFQIVFDLPNLNAAFAPNKLLAFRIPEIQINGGGGFSFELAGDVTGFLGGGATAPRCLLFISGIVEADTLSQAGRYRKPTQPGEDAFAVETPGTGPPRVAYANRLSIPLEDVLVSPGDVIVFVDEDGNPLPAIDTGGAVFTGPDFVVLSVDSDTNEVVVEDREDNESPSPGRTTEVWRFVSPVVAPVTLLENNYRVFSANTAHTHKVFSTDIDEKPRNDGDHGTVHNDHTHTIPEQAIIAPFASFQLCVKL